MMETPITKAIDRLIDLQLERHAWLAGAASGIETEGQDREDGLGAEHESPTSEAGDAK